MCCGGVPVRGVWECACESAVHPPAVNTTNVDKISAFFKKEISVSWEQRWPVSYLRRI